MVWKSPFKYQIYPSTQINWKAKLMMLNSIDEFIRSGYELFLSASRSKFTNHLEIKFTKLSKLYISTNKIENRKTFFPYLKSKCSLSLLGSPYHKPRDKLKSIFFLYSSNQRPS